MPQKYPATIALALAVTSAAPARSADPRSMAALLQVEDAWTKAEERGDATFVDALLLPDYVSVSADGKVHDKAAIVAHARKQQRGDADLASKIAAWRLAHPYRIQVRILGDTAIVSFISTRQGADSLINSSDIFVLRSGRWHAAYSQHSAAEAL